MVTTIGTFPGVSFANGNTFGARVVRQHRDRLPERRTGSGRPRHAERGRVTGGQIGIWFSGTTNTAAGNARIDNFGGGTLP